MEFSEDWVDCHFYGCAHREIHLPSQFVSQLFMNGLYSAGLPLDGASDNFNFVVSDIDPTLVVGLSTPLQVENRLLELIKPVLFGHDFSL